MRFLDLDVILFQVAASSANNAPSPKRLSVALLLSLLPSHPLSRLQARNHLGFPRRVLKMENISGFFQIVM